jgi:hypothetical protein
MVLGRAATATTRTSTSSWDRRWCEAHSEEYELAFLDPDEAVFPHAIIDAAFTSEVLPLW